MERGENILYIVTSYSADFAPPRPSLRFTLRRRRAEQLKLAGLPSHPIFLRCLIVLKIEEITECDLCTNKIMSGPWQERALAHTHAYIQTHTHARTHAHTAACSHTGKHRRHVCHILAESHAHSAQLNRHRTPHTDIDTRAHAHARTHIHTRTYRVPSPRYSPISAGTDLHFQLSFCVSPRLFA